MAIGLKIHRMYLALALGFTSVSMSGLAASQDPQGASKAPTLKSGPDLTKLSLSDLEQSSHRLGSADAPITIVEFVDLYCPSCHKVQQKILNLVARNKGKVSLIFHHFPLTKIHPLSLHASTLSEQLDSHDFWAFTTNVLKPSTKLSQPDLDHLFAMYHAAHTRSESQAKAKVMEDLKVTQAAGINQTPTFLIFVDRKEAATANMDFEEVLKRPEFAKYLQPASH